MQKFLLGICALLCFNEVFAATDTVNVYFRNGEYILTTEAKYLLDSLIYYDKINSSKQTAILGYADYTNEEKPDTAIAIKRTVATAGYLTEMGIGSTMIKWWDTSFASGRADIILIAGCADSVLQTEKRTSTTETTNNIVHEPLHIDITGVDVDQTLRLDIHFEGGKDKILPESEHILKALLQVMSDNPKLKISVEGHICCILRQELYDKKYMKSSNELSKKRARAVYDYLVANGISARRLKYKGFGFSRPLANPENNDDDRTRNRRVEIRITAK